MTGDAAVILIVEDEPPIRRLLRMTLGAQDYRTIEASTGAEALTALRHHRPDLVLLDLGLPDIDGQALIGRIRELSPGEIQWTDGMLYPVLHWLEANGCIRGRWEKAESGRRRRYYAVLPKGRKSLEEHCAQWTVVHSTMNKLWTPKYA
jgi:CheY-like chemotaxis protein